MSGRHSLSHYVEILLRPLKKAVDSSTCATGNTCQAMPEFQIPESGIKTVVNGVLEQARELERRVGIAEADSKRLQALSKKISDAFVCVETSGEVIDFNQAFSNLFDITMEDVRTTPEGLVRIAGLLSVIRNAASVSGCLLSNRFSMETSPGVTKLLEVAKVSVDNARGQEQVYILRDLTTEQEWSDRLTKSEKTLSAVSEASQIISELPLGGSSSEGYVSSVGVLWSGTFSAHPH